MKRIADTVADVVEWWTALLLAAMVLLVALGVFFRYALGSALVWYDEFASYLLVWLTFYGGVVASYRRRHIGLEVVVERLSGAWRLAAELVAQACCFGFQLVLCYHGWLLSDKIADETAVSLSWVKMTWVYSVLPISGGLMLLVSAAELVRLISGRGAEQQDADVEAKGGQVAWSGSSSE